VATNRIYKPGEQLAVACSHPTTPTSGSPVRYGQMTGVALTDENSDGLTTVDFGPAVWDLSVKGVDGSGNSAVAAGDALFYVDGDTPPLSKKATGYFFGIALEAVSSGATGTINVAHVPSPGAGTLGTGTVSATNLASGAVTAAKLAGNLAVGFIPLNITTLREAVTNAIPNTAANGGLLASDTTPVLERVNGATDKALRVKWAASNSDEVQFGPVMMPPDLDEATDLTIHLLAAMGGATDTPTIDVQVFDGLGDTEMGGATAAITGTTIAEYSVTIANANVAGAPLGFLNIALVPGAHTTDTLLLYGAWIEYSRKG
jgi:hypothetical protein